MRSAHGKAIIVSIEMVKIREVDRVLLQLFEALYWQTLGVNHVWPEVYDSVVVAAGLPPHACYDL
jgi:hypothetical protein